jgi:hypothetical protein
VAIVVATAGAFAARQATGTSTESKGTPEAKALLAQAEAKMRGAPDYDAGIVLLKQAIQADPHFAEAFERLYAATHSAATAKANQTQAKAGDLVDAGMNDLKKQYAAWAAADRRTRFSRGRKARSKRRTGRREGLYDRAVVLDPYFARPYLQLALIADFSGDNQQQVAT